MSVNDPADKVINLSRMREQRDGASAAKTKKKRGRKARVIAITSGKGGVGKTSIVANLGYAFTKLGKKVLILDADLGLGNLDVLLGLAPKYNLSHVIMEEKTIEEILIEGPGKMKILPASSGIQVAWNPPITTGTDLSRKRSAMAYPRLARGVMMLMAARSGRSSKLISWTFSSSMVTSISPGVRAARVVRLR